MLKCRCVTCFQGACVLACLVTVMRLKMPLYLAIVSASLSMNIASLIVSFFKKLVSRYGGRHMLAYVVTLCHRNDANVARLKFLSRILGKKDTTICPRFNFNFIFFRYARVVQKKQGLNWQLLSAKFFTAGTKLW